MAISPTFQEGISTSSPTPTAVPTSQPEQLGTSVENTQVSRGVKATITNVIDGDTVKIETGETVRYIGIDTPEIVHPSKPVQCYAKEASEKNKELVEGKVVELEKDVSEKDKYGRLLRYIWLGDNLVNEQLVRDGYAYASSYPPDIKYQDKFTEAQRLAREESKGLWGSACAVTPKPTSSPTPKPTVKPAVTSAPLIINTPTQAPAQTSGGGTYVCNCSKKCSQMSSCAEAQYQLNVCGCSARDGDDDGIACDSDCQ